QASKIYLGIYGNRKEESNRLVTFWKTDLPLVIRKHQRIILFAFILFVLFIAIGYFSASREETLIRDLFGDDYINRRERDIENGNPFGLYQYGNPVLMFFGLMIHNISVSLRMFAEGLLFGIFTIKDLVLNGMMIGFFEQFYFSKGLGQVSVLTIMIHGTLELSALVLSGTAGIVLGKSYLFPGTISRLASLKQGAKEGVKIMIGIMPVFIMAAFFEGFVTRYYQMPMLFNILILAVSAGFIAWYFVIYPIRIQKKLSFKLSEEE
ncbi:MAG: stage II sporulation protein M, partial [Chitinophagaceae bacterium]